MNMRNSFCWYRGRVTGICVELAAVAAVVGTASTSFAQNLDSASFTYKYEMSVLPSTQNLGGTAANDFQFIVLSVGTISTSGDGNADVVMPMLASGQSNSYMSGAESNGIWTEVFTSGSLYTIEFRAKVVQFTPGLVHPDDGLPITGALGVFTSQTNGTANRRGGGQLWLADNYLDWGYQPGGSHLLSGINNTNDFHTYRFVKKNITTSGSAAFEVWRDGVSLGNLSRANSGNTNFMFFGGGSGALAGESKLDYLRLHVGNFAPPIVTWDGSTDTDWSVGLNWAGDATPTNNVAILGTGQTQAPTANQPVLNGTDQVGGVNFNSGLAGWNISGTGTLTVGSGGIDATNQAHDGTNPITTYVTNTVSVANIVLNDDSTWTMGSGDSYRKVSVSSVVSGSRNLTVSGGGSVGAGTLELTGANTFSGTTRVAGGALSLLNGQALQNSTLDMNVADSGSVTYDNAITSITLGGLSGTRNFSYNSAASITVGSGNKTAGPYSGVLSGTGSLTKIGTSTQTISGANTYDGGTNINAGTLQFGNLTAMPAVGTVTVSSGATLAVNIGGPGEWTSSDVPADPGSVAGLIAGTGGQGALNQVVWSSGSNLGIDTSNAGGSATYAGVIGQFATGGDTHGLAKLGSGTLTLTANNTYTGGTALNGGTLALGSSGAIGSVGTISFGGGTLQFSSSNTTDYSARFSTAASQAYRLDTNGESVTLATALTSSGGSLTKLGAGTLSLTNANTYTGTTSVSGGTLEFATIGNVGGGASNLGSPTTVANGTIALSGGGTLRYTGSATSTNRVLNLSVTATGGAVDASGSGAITFTSNLAATGGGSKTLTLRGTNTGDNTFSGIIGNGTGGGTTSVTKDDAGKWILGGVNTYTGATTVSSGTLLVNGSLAFGSAVTVNGGVLGGTGAIVGSVTVASGGTLSPGASIESLDVGSLAINGGNLTFELGAPGSPGVTSDLINVVSANGLSITSGTVDLINFGGLAGGTYRLVEYAGTAKGDATVDLLTLGLQPAGFTYDLVDNATNLSIDLVVTAAGVPGDFNNDGKVNAADYVVWRKTMPENTAKYIEWRQNFGNPPGAGSGSGLDGGAVPEPASLMLVAMSLALLVGWRRHAGAQRCSPAAMSLRSIH